jgi:polysaccharide export outer membrane protein
MRKTGSLVFLVTTVLALVLFFCEVSQGETIVDKEYLIKPQDGIKTYVYANTDLNISATVPPDGIVAFPLAGEINILNMTTDQLSKILSEKLSYYLKDPQVSVYITAIQPLKVYVLGAVTKAGAIDFKPGNRLTDYISEAGGFVQNADMKKCYVYPEDKSYPVKIIDMQLLLEEGNTDLNIEIKAFDTVYIKKKPGFIFENWRDVAEFMRIITGIMTIYLWVDKI